MVKIYPVIQTKLIQLVYENVNMITDLPRKLISALSRWQTFLRVFTYKMAAKINRIGLDVEHYYVSVTLCIIGVGWSVKLYAQDEVTSQSLFSMGHDTIALLWVGL